MTVRAICPLVVLLAVAACDGGGGVHEVDASAGTQSDAAVLSDAASPDATVSASDAGDSPPDAGVAADGSPHGPRIDAVQTDQGFTQVHQGAGFEPEDFVVLVVSGANLADTAGVSIGAIEGVLVEATDEEVRASFLIPHGEPPGPREVTLDSPQGGAVTAPSGIEITPWVVGAEGPEPGQGTYQSPMRLCDPRLSATTAGEIIDLLPGVHRCSSGGVALRRGGQTISGAGSGSTFLELDGPRIRVESSLGSTTVLRDFSIRGRTGSDLIRVSGSGAVQLDRLVVDRGTITVADAAEVDAQQVSFRDAEVSSAGRARLKVADCSFTDGRVRAHGGNLELLRTTFDGASGGVRLGPSGPADQLLTAWIDDVTFSTLDPGLIQWSGITALRDSDFRRGEGSVRPPIGISIRGGELDATNISIDGYEEAAIDGLLELPQTRARIALTDARIRGGSYGVRLRGDSVGGGLVMRSSTVEGQSAASVSTTWRRAGVHDLSGGNTFSVVSGVAVDDLRIEPTSGQITARGLTLNGAAREGAFSGPVDASPDFRLAHAWSSIDFESGQSVWRPSVWWLPAESSPR